jgi:hypothetical protein
LLALTAIGVLAQTTAQSERVRELNAQVLQLQAAVQTAKSSQQAVLAGERSSVFDQRLNALTMLIEQDPGQALRLAFPPDLLEELAAAFPQQKAKLESHGQWQGPVEYFILDGANPKFIARMRTGNEDVLLHFASGQAPNSKSRDVLSVRGVRAGDRIAVHAVEMSPMLAEASNLVHCSSVGDQKIAVILVEFENSKLPSSLNASRVRSILLGNSAGGPSSTPDWSVDDFWQQNSGGKTRVKRTGTGALTVVGPYNLGAGIGCDQQFTLFRVATRAANKDLNYKNFSRLLIVHPTDASCSVDASSLGCTSTLGCAADGADGACGHSWGFLQADHLRNRELGVSLTAHSLGHQLGLGHGSGADFGDDPLGPLDEPPGVVNEYGDLFSAMGAGWKIGFYSAQHAIDTLGWFEKNKQYLDVFSSGAHSIEWLGKPGGGIKALKIQRGPQNFAGRPSIFLEFRQNKGIYDSTLSPQVWSGGLLHYSPDNDEKSFLLDFTPQSAGGFEDPALAVGKTWADPYSNLTLKVDSIVNDMLNVTVTYGPERCVNVAPVVKIEPLQRWGRIGQAVSYTVTVTNWDAPECTSTFALSSSRTSDGWAGTFQPQMLTIDAGASASSIFTVTPPPDAAGATHHIGVTATNTANDASSGDNASCTVSHTAKPGPPEAPFPANSATGIGLTPNLKWSGGAGATTNKVYLGTTNPPPFVTWSTEANFMPAPLDPKTKYFWKVEPTNGAGVNDNTPIWSFTTGAPLPGKPTVEGPARGLYPPIRTNTPDLVWNPPQTGGFPQSYDVYLGTTPDPPLVANVPHSKPHLNWNVRYSPGTLEWATQYWWRVVAKNAVGSTSSNTWMFRIIPEPGAPGLRYPPLGNVGIPRTTHLQWSAAAGDIVHYKLYFGATNPPPFLQNVTGTTLKFSIPNQLPAKTKFFWRVVAVTTQGKELKSDLSWFTTK